MGNFHKKQEELSVMGENFFVAPPIMPEFWRENELSAREPKGNIFAAPLIRVMGQHVIRNKKFKNDRKREE